MSQPIDGVGGKALGDMPRFDLNMEQDELTALQKRVSKGVRIQSVEDLMGAMDEDLDSVMRILNVMKHEGTDHEAVMATNMENKIRTYLEEIGAQNNFSAFA